MQMAARRFYAYYIRGSQIALVEHDNVSGSGQTLGQPSLDDIGPSGALSWKSPVASITNGLEIEYAYSPRYRINDADDTKATSAYGESGGYLWFTVASMSATAGDWVLIRGSEKWNGLHQVKTTISGAVAITFNTKYNGGAVTESSTLYQDVDALNDETDTIDLPEYLAKGLVYYVKAKVAEDRGEIEQKEYNMREFRRILEKHESSKIRGPRMMIPGGHGIR